MKNYQWHAPLKELFHRAIEKYQRGERGAASYFNADELAYLASIGQTAQELYDFAEDHARGGDPEWETVLLITSARRDYFLAEQQGQTSSHRIDMAALPSKDAEIEGIGWLPRLIAKAESKLRGEMPDDLMYDCGGDRGFFKHHDVHPADFLRAAWGAKGDAAKLVRFVRGK